jgi:hypothetical protein
LHQVGVSFDLDLVYALVKQIFFEINGVGVKLT